MIDKIIPLVEFIPGKFPAINTGHNHLEMVLTLFDCNFSISLSIFLSDNNYAYSF
jgi:hypothetical protein